MNTRTNVSRVLLPHEQSGRHSDASIRAARVQVTDADCANQLTACGHCRAARRDARGHSTFSHTQHYLARDSSASPAAAARIRTLFSSARVTERPPERSLRLVGGHDARRPVGGSRRVAINSNVIGEQRAADIHRTYSIYIAAEGLTFWFCFFLYFCFERCRVPQLHLTSGSIGF